jgi:hypothetical protein
VTSSAFETPLFSILLRCRSELKIWEEEERKAEAAAKGLEQDAHHRFLRAATSGGGSGTVLLPWRGGMEGMTSCPGARRGAMGGGGVDRPRPS